jgi:hypothetical protein
MPSRMWWFRWTWVMVMKSDELGSGGRDGGDRIGSDDGGRLGSGSGDGLGPGGDDQLGSGDGNWLGGGLLGCDGGIIVKIQVKDGRGMVSQLRLIGENKTGRASEITLEAGLSSASSSRIN